MKKSELSNHLYVRFKDKGLHQQAASSYADMIVKNIPINIVNDSDALCEDMEIIGAVLIQVATHIKNIQVDG